MKGWRILMKKKLLSLASPVGLLIWGIYLIVNRFITEIPDAVAYPMMFVSVILMMIGIVVGGYRFGKRTKSENK